MTFTTIAFLFFVGLFGGALNAIAGGAMLFTFPALMLVGVPPISANASNYLALLPANAAALPAYRREIRQIGSNMFPLMVVSCGGAVLGSILLLVSSEAVFTGLVPLLVLLATGLFAFGERARGFIISRFSAGNASKVLYVALFVASIYGGYFGAGLGIVLLAIIQIMGYSSFHDANAIKNAISVVLTILSLGIFGFGGIIAWPEAFVMMIGAIVGGYLAAHTARRIDDRFIRRAIIMFGSVLAVIYAWRFWFA